MEHYNGNDRILYIKHQDIWMPIACLTSNSFDESSEMLDTTTRDNAGWTTSKPISQTYSITFDGLQIISDGSTMVSYDRLKNIKRNKVLIEWKIQGTKYPVVDSGKAYLSALSDTNVVDEFISFTGTLTGFGKPEISDNRGDWKKEDFNKNDFKIYKRV